MTLKLRKNVNEMKTICRAMSDKRTPDHSCWEPDRSKHLALQCWKTALAWTSCEKKRKDNIVRNIRVCRENRCFHWFHYFYLEKESWHVCTTSASSRFNTDRVTSTGRSRGDGWCLLLPKCLSINACQEIIELGEVDLVTAWPKVFVQTRYGCRSLKPCDSCMLYVGKLAAAHVLECILLRWAEYLKSCITGFVGLKLIMLVRGFRYITPPSWEIELEQHDMLPQQRLSTSFMRPRYLKCPIITQDTKTHFLKTNFLLRNKKKFYTLVKPV